jgi:hypothetical protein
MIGSYLAAERDVGRVAANADIDTLAPTIIGAAHLLFTDRESTPPDAGAVHRMVTTIMAARHSPPLSERSVDGPGYNCPMGAMSGHRCPS